LPGTITKCTSMESRNNGGKKKPRKAPDLRDMGSEDPSKVGAGAKRHGLLETSRGGQTQQRQRSIPKPKQHRRRKKPERRRGRKPERGGGERLTGVRKPPGYRGSDDGKTWKERTRKKEKDEARGAHTYSSSAGGGQDSEKSQKDMKGKRTEAQHQ